MEENSGERRRQKEDRRYLHADRRTYEEFPCAFVYILQPTKILMPCFPAQTHANYWQEHAWFARFTGCTFFKKTDMQYSLTFTLAITTGQLASLFQGSLQCWSRRGGNIVSQVLHARDTRCHPWPHLPLGPGSIAQQSAGLLVDR